MVMSPQYFRSDVVEDVDSSDSNCCLLYFNANMCSFTKKASASGGLPPDPLLGLHPLTPLGDFVPQTLYQGSTPGPHWGTSVPQTLVFFYVPPNNPVRSTPLTSLHHVHV